MNRLTYYLNRKFLVRFAVIMFTVAGFAIIFDLLETGSRVLRRAGGGWETLLWYAAVRLPTLITDLLPLVALVAALVTINDLLRHRELVIIWTAGVSRAGMVARLLPAALLLFAGKLVIDDVAIPRTMPALKELGVVEFGRVIGPTDAWLWVRNGEDVIRLPADSRGGEDLKNVLIFKRDAEGRTIEMIRAASATPEATGWQLHDVLRQASNSRPPQAVAEMFLPITVRVDKFELMGKAPRELTLVELAGAVANRGYGLGSTEGQKTWLNGRFAAATTMMLMVFLGVSIVRRFERTSMVIQIFVQGMAIGFMAMIFQGALLAFGEVGLINAAASAWSVPLVLLVLLLRWTGLLRLPRRERREDQDFGGHFRLATAGGETRTGRVMPFGSERADRRG